MSTILIVDDIEENLYLLRVILEGNGYTVEEASNGSEALVKALAKLPDLIITDILMPVIDGFTLCRIWKADERLAMVPFIFYTATYTDPRDERLALDMGADAFIVKPTEPAEFLSMIENILVNSQKGELIPPKKPRAGEEAILKSYNEVLVRKLEDKMLGLEKANKELEAEIGARTKAEHALRESEEIFREMFHQHEAVKLIIDLDTGKIIDANDAASAFYGWKHEQLINLHIQEINTLPVGELKKEIEKVRNQKKFRFEFRHRKADGSERDVEVLSSRIRINGKEFLHSIINDITDRKTAEEQIARSLKEKDALLKELHHRVKNNLQVISSMIGLQEKYIVDERDRELVKDISTRIHSMALIHERLYQNEKFSMINFSEHLEQLINDLSLMYKSPKQRITFTKQVDDELQLDINYAIPCSLIITELVTNSIKFAFPDKKEGEIKITFQRNSNNEFILGVKDNGIGLPDDFDFPGENSIGLTLVSVLVEQLKGKLELIREGGLEYVIRCFIDKKLNTFTRKNDV